MSKELFSNLTRQNVASYAATNYNNPHFTKLEQFNRDLRKISIIKKHMNKFDSVSEDEELSTLVRKITNNIIIFLNLFGEYSGMRILFTLMEERFYHKLKPILSLILDDELPLIIEGVNNTNVILEHIKQDEFFASFLNHMEKYRGIYAKHDRHEFERSNII